MITRLTVRSALLLALVLLAPVFTAQPVSAAQPADGAAAPPTLAESREARLARRTALLDLRLLPSPSVEDYAAAAALLELVIDLAPGDALLRREVISAHAAAGNDDAVLRHTRELLRVDPRDTVAQTRLITAQIAARQTVEERIELYERFLGPRGERIDPSVRSRVALDAALLRRELGDRQGFYDGLARALELDSTNKDAAELAAEVFAADASGDPLALLELEINLLYADPLDPGVHRAIAGLLIAEGALEQGRRFHENAVRLATLTGGITEELDIEQTIMAWLTEDAAEVSRNLEGQLKAFRASAEAQLEAAIAADEPTDGLLEPEEVRLAPLSEMVRLLLAHDLGNEERVAASLEDFQATLLATVEALRERIEAGDTDAAATGYAAFQTMQLSRVITGLQLDRLADDLRNQVERNPGLAPLLTSFQPWLSYHTGDYEEALRLASRPRPAFDEVSALAGAAALEQLGRTDEAISAYRAVARRSPLSTTGAHALRKVEKLGGETATDVGRQMSAFAARVPAWVDRMILQPRTFASLDLETEQRSHAPGEPPTLRLRIRNIAPVPLSFGPRAAISSRFLILGLIDRDTPGFVGAPQPGVIEADARLRLESREELVLEFPADAGFTGWLTDTQPGMTIRRRWRALQGFEIGRRGVFIAGGTSLASETDGVIRTPSRFASLDLPELVEALQTGEPPHLVLPVLRTRLMEIQGESSPADRRDAADALLEYYRAADMSRRVLLLAEIPSASQVGEFDVFDAGVLVDLSEGESPLVIALALLTRVADADDPALAAALEHTDERVRKVAGSLAERLGDDRPTLGSVEPGLEALAGPTPASQRASE